MSRYDDEIRAVEARLVRDRQALVQDAQDLAATARDAMSSPKGLAIAFAAGFLLGELTAPRRPRKSRGQQTAETTKKLGLGGLLGSALFAFVRARYGSPWVLARHALDYYLSMQRARQSAMQRPASTSSARAARSRQGSGSGPAPVAPREAQREATAGAAPLHEERRAAS